ncbi:MAG TPA: Rieske 2Fe-2S domain-containing protein [bacterium]|nr:Rieske 2Fe-2S domain-containing protein [bacterium]
MGTPKPLKIVEASGLKEGRTVKFIIQRPDRETEAFVFRKNGKILAYLNLCRHWTVGLDFDDNEFFSPDGEWLVCKNHGAIYHPQTGRCESGPCGGASLYPVPIIEKDGFLFADVGKIDWGDA